MIIFNWDRIEEVLKKDRDLIRQASNNHELNVGIAKVFALRLWIVVWIMLRYAYVLSVYIFVNKSIIYVFTNTM